MSLTGRTPAQVAALIPGYDVKLVPVAHRTRRIQDIIQYFGADIVTDLDVTYQLNDRVTAGGRCFEQSLRSSIPTGSMASTAAASCRGHERCGQHRYAALRVHRALRLQRTVPLREICVPVLKLCADLY